MNNNEFLKDAFETVSKVAASEECQAFMKLATGIVASTLSKHAVKLATTHPAGAVVVSAVALGAVIYSSVKTRRGINPEFSVAA